jgi:hypothetical protein
MDPYDQYMQQQEEWQNEIAKRDERIKKLEKALTWYADPHNLVQYIGGTEKWVGGDHFFNTYMLPGVAKVAIDALGKSVELEKRVTCSCNRPKEALKECDHNWVRLELENRTVCARCEKEK